MYDEVVLIRETMQVDEIGQRVAAAELKAPVFCYAESVSRAEWNTAHQNDLQAGWKLTLEAADYNGEKLAEFRGQRYAVYRTFSAKGKTELYLGVRVGEMDGIA